MEVITEHLHNAHNLSPFECLKCAIVFENFKEASAHCGKTSRCTSLDIHVNFGPIYNNSVKTISPIASSTSDSLSSDEILKTTDNFKCLMENCCPDCSFKCLSIEKFKLHRVGHNPKKSRIKIF